MESILANLLMEKDMEMVSLYGIMVRNSKDSGRMAKRTALVFGNLQRETITKANGRIIDSTAKDILSISEDLSIVGISSNFLRVGKGHSNSTMGISTQELTSKANLTDTANTYGQTETVTKGNSSRVQEKERVHSVNLRDRSTTDSSKMT